MTSELLKRRRDVTKADLAMKLEIEDWHGVADAAMDLREIDAMLAVISPTPMVTFSPIEVLGGHRWVYRIASDDFRCLDCGSVQSTPKDTECSKQTEPSHA